MFFILRITIGLVFLVSGVEKALNPYQNFLYAIQAYELLPSWAERASAQIFPWLELCVGLLLVLGLWTRQALLAALVFFAIFISIVGQALWRGLDIDQCGCFGQLVHLQPHLVIVLDSIMLLMTFMLLRFLPQTRRFSLDQSFK